MKTNLKNFPKYAPVDKKKCYDWFEYGRLVNDWKTDFEKEIQRKDRKFANEWLNYPEEDISIFIKEILGDEK